MFGFFRRLLGITPTDKVPDVPEVGIDEANSWLVPGGIPDYARFFRALSELVPEGSALYLEGGSPPSWLKEILDDRKLPEKLPVAKGIIWPRPPTYHLPTDSHFLEVLAKASEQCAVPEIAINVAVYNDGVVLLYSPDVHCGITPFHISKMLAEEKVHRFCDAIGVAAPRKPR